MHESHEDQLGGFWINETRMEDVDLDLKTSHEISGLCILHLAYLFLFQQDRIPFQHRSTRHPVIRAKSQY